MRVFLFLALVTISQCCKPAPVPNPETKQNLKTIGRNIGNGLGIGLDAFGLWSAITHFKAEFEEAVGEIQIRVIREAISSLGEDLNTAEEVMQEAMQLIHASFYACIIMFIIIGFSLWSVIYLKFKIYVTKKDLKAFKSFNNNAKV